MLLFSDNLSAGLLVLLDCHVLERFAQFLDSLYVLEDVRNLSSPFDPYSNIFFHEDDRLYCYDPAAEAVFYWIHRVHDNTEHAQNCVVASVRIRAVVDRAVPHAEGVPQQYEEHQQRRYEHVDDAGLYFSDGYLNERRNVHNQVHCDELFLLHEEYVSGVHRWVVNDEANRVNDHLTQKKQDNDEVVVPLYGQVCVQHEQRLQHCSCHEHKYCGDSVQI